MKNPYEDCPKFDVCNCNICPLDPNMSDKEGYPEEDKCRVTRKMRLAIVKKWAEFQPEINFTYGGLTKREAKRHKTSITLGGKGLLFSPLSKIKKNQWG